MAQWVNHLWNNVFINLPPLPLLCEISGALHLVQLGLMVLHHTKTWLAHDIISYSGRLFLCVLYYIVNFEIIALDK